MTAHQQALMGLRVRDARLQRYLRLTDLAQMLNITASHLANIESGRKKPSLDIMADISWMLAVSLDYLVLGIRGETDDGALILRSDDELEIAYPEIISELIRINEEL